MAKSIQKKEVLEMKSLIPDDIVNDEKSRPRLYLWEKVIGKFYPHNGEKVIPGGTYQATKDYFADDPTWKRLGPIDGKEEDDAPDPVPAIPKLKAISVGDGLFDVYRTSDDGKVNDEPLSEKEAMELVNASVDDN